MELEVEPPLKMCVHGLHASERIIDALGYAPGPVVCMVELSGEIIRDKDKICAQKRKVIWMYDASSVLHEFACIVAEQALQKEREAGKEPDPRSWKAVEMKKRWLRGEATDGELLAARTAAWAAARAAWAAARTVARAETAAWEAAWAARAAAEAATEAAAEAATRAAARATARAAGEAVGVAAWSAGAAARTAAREEQNALLEKMIEGGKRWGEVVDGN